MSEITKNELLKLLKERFKKYPQTLNWDEIESKILSNEKYIDALLYMQQSGGEVGFWKEDKGKLLFTDFSSKTPEGRRNLCYDKEALDKRKKFKPSDSAVNLCEKYGIRLLTEDEYRELQELFKFDLTTSTWIYTPSKIRSLGGALFCDRRYDTVFTYHNGADSYYASRGFRAILEIK